VNFGREVNDTWCWRKSYAEHLRGARMSDGFMLQVVHGQTHGTDVTKNQRLERTLAESCEGLKLRALFLHRSLKHAHQETSVVLCCPDFVCAQPRASTVTNENEMKHAHTQVIEAFLADARGSDPIPRILDRLLSGDLAALDEIRALLHSSPDIWDHSFDSALQTKIANTCDVMRFICSNCFCDEWRIPAIWVLASLCYDRRDNQSLLTKLSEWPPVEYEEAREKAKTAVDEGQPNNDEIRAVATLEYIMNRPAGMRPRCGTWDDAWFTRQLGSSYVWDE